MNTGQMTQSPESSVSLQKFFTETYMELKRVLLQF